MSEESGDLRQRLTRAKQTLQAHVERFRSILLKSMDAILIVDRDGVIQHANPAAEVLFERSARDLVGQEFGVPLIPGGTCEVVIACGRDPRPVAEMRILDTDWENRPVTMIWLRDITHHKRQESALLSALEQVQNIRYALDKSAIVAVTDVQGVIEYVNDKFCEISGYRRDELIGRTHRVINSGFHSRDFWKELWRTIARGDIWRGEIRNRAKDGSYYWVATTIVPFLNEQGKPRQYIAIRHEITERKSAEDRTHQLNAQLERRNRELMALHEVGRVLASTLDLEEIGRVVYREVAQRLLNVPHLIIALIDPTSQLIACRFAVVDGLETDASAFPPMPINEGPILTVLQSRQPLLVDIDLVTRGRFTLGEEKHSRAALYVPLISRDHLIGVIIAQHYAEDVFLDTDMTLIAIIASQAAVALDNAQLYQEVRRHAGELEVRVATRTMELQQERANLQTTLDAMVEGVAYIDEATQETRYVNGAFSRLTGYAPDEVVQKPARVCRDILNLPERYGPDLIMRGAEYANGAWHYGTRIRRKDGSESDVQITVTWVPGAGGQSVGEVLLFRDVGQEKALQAQKDRFIASASHELRTPVTNLKMRLYLARHQPDKVNDHLAAIENSTNHMMNLVENLLDVSRFERGLIVLHHELVSLQELVEQVVEDQRLVAEERHVALESDLPPAPIDAYIDPDRILQVIANLVANAINYTPANGRVQVRLHREGYDGREQAVIAVKDTGIGIPPEATAHIFEPFYRGPGQASVKGTGLGLTIVREIVTLHGGEVSVQSEIGVGSTFFVRLPLN